MISKHLSRIQNKITNKLRAWRIEKELISSFKQNKLDSKKPTVHLDLRYKHVETYYYTFIFFFEQAGYQIFLENKNGFLGSFIKYGNYLKEIKSIVLDQPSQIEKTLFITDRSINNNNKYLKTIILSLNVFRRKELHMPYLLFPYPMHPNAYGLKYYEKIANLRNTKKKNWYFLFW